MTTTMEKERIFEIELTEEELKIVGIALTCMPERLIDAIYCDSAIHKRKDNVKRLKIATALINRISEIIENSTH